LIWCWTSTRSTWTRSTSRTRPFATTVAKRSRLAVGGAEWRPPLGRVPSHLLAPPQVAMTFRRHDEALYT
jgi:hypothetical protein